MGKTFRINKIWNILMPLAIYYVVYMISFFLLSYFYQAAVAKSGAEIAFFLQEQKATLTGIVNGISMLLGALVLVPSLRVELQEHRSRVVSYGWQNTSGQKMGTILITVILAFSSAVGLNVLLSLTGLVQNSASYQEVAQSQYGVAFGVGAVLYAVVSPVAEEIVFRGIIYNRMRRYLSEWQDGKGYQKGQAGQGSGAGVAENWQTTGSSVIASGVLFGVYHGNLVQGVYGGCMGILMAYMYERTHTFYIPCLFHATANCVVYVLAQDAALHDRIFTFPWCVGLLAVSFSMILIVEKRYLLHPC